MTPRLDLTATSRVHLLEPQWNPSLEDQALARAHRLGQTQPVTTLRYVMRNSIEEVTSITVGRKTPHAEMNRASEHYNFL
ncbi:hypothetical protein CC80DRAFT_425457 [Byssothecium circinans]|uniref:Helicase C-terminal domain-containing protein n=1 Tax=Byssothecium circinans TaxID=147558 RepID=A0A6A5TJR4_9PLEO|nr:hypothetical protein CC80DRAFT_425457 [Byssothecium circinans]